MTTILEKKTGAPRLGFRGQTYDFSGKDHTLSLEDDRLARAIAREHREVQIVKHQKKKEEPRMENKTKSTPSTPGGDR